MQIRAATPADARSIAEVHVASWHAGYRGLVPDDVLASLSVDDRERQWSEHIPRVTVLIAEDHNQLAGFLAFAPATGEIGALYVAPDRFRTGVGSALLTTAHEQLAQAGRTEAVLWVFEANRAAREFYAAHGYTPDGATAPEPRSGLEEIRMWRNLNRNTRGRP